MCAIGAAKRAVRKKTKVAYRAYSLTSGGQLRPLFFHRYAPLGTPSAVADIVPTLGNLHGLWAHKTASARNAYGHGSVYATVECAGTIIEHEKGYRAERITILSLSLPADRCLDAATVAKQLRIFYKVPVRVR